MSDVSVNNNNATKHSRYFFNSCDSFRKRAFIFFLVIIIAFTSSFKSTEKEVHAFLVELSLIIGITSGIVLTAAEAYSLYKQVTGGDEDECDEFFDANVSLDENGNYVLTDEAVAVINAMVEAYDNEVTYVDGYIAKSNQIDPDSFLSKSAYDMLVNLIKSHPDKAFSVYKDQDSTGYSNPRKEFEIRCANVPYAGVCGSLSITTDNTTFYSDDWTTSFDVYVFRLYDSASGSYLSYTDSSGNSVKITDASDVSGLEFSDVKLTENTFMYNSKLGISANYYDAGYRITGSYIMFSDYGGSIPVFNNLTNLKRGTEMGTKGQFLPGYTGQPITDNSITQTEINDYSTNYNYYYGSSGSGSGSGSDGSGGSSGSGFLSGILDFVEAILDGILEILGRLLSALGDAISLIVDTFLDIIDLFDGGFVDFISAIFPYFPKEWITAITLALVLAVLGVIIRAFI